MEHPFDRDVSVSMTSRTMIGREGAHLGSTTYSVCVRRSHTGEYANGAPRSENPERTSKISLTVGSKEALGGFGAGRASEAPIRSTTRETAQGSRPERRTRLKRNKDAR